MAAKFLAGEIGGGLTIEDLEAEKAKTEHVNAMANIEQAAPEANLEGSKRGQGNRKTDDDKPEGARGRIFTILGDSAFFLSRHNGVNQSLSKEGRHKS